MSDEVKITTGLIRSYLAGRSLSLDHLTDAVEAVLAQMDADGSEEAVLTVRIVRNTSVHTKEQLEALRKERQSKS